MPQIFTLDGQQFLGHGTCGIVASWDPGNGGAIPPCHGNDFIVIDDHHHIDRQGARLGPPGGGQTTSGLTYEAPIDCRSLFFDNSIGTRRTFGMEGACVDLAVDLRANQRLVFSWKFISFDRGSPAGDNFAMVLAYQGPNPPPIPQSAPAIDQVNSTPITDLLQGAIRLPDSMDTEHLDRRRLGLVDEDHQVHSQDTWSTSMWQAPSGGFSGVIRWIACTGWVVRRPNKPGTDKNALEAQRAYPPALLLDCVEIVSSTQ